VDFFAGMLFLRSLVNRHVPTRGHARNNALV
jgi:hypothetical protein